MPVLTINDSLFVELRNTPGVKQEALEALVHLVNSNPVVNALLTQGTGGPTDLRFSLGDPGS